MVLRYRRIFLDLLACIPFITSNSLEQRRHVSSTYNNKNLKFSDPFLVPIFSGRIPLPAQPHRFLQSAVPAQHGRPAPDHARRQEQGRVPLHGRCADVGAAKGTGQRRHGVV